MTPGHTSLGLDPGIGIVYKFPNQAKCFHIDLRGYLRIVHDNLSPIGAELRP